MDNDAFDAGRRNLLRAAGVGAAAFGLGVTPQLPAATTNSSQRTAAGAKGGPYNALFILTDQERHFRPGE